MNIKHFLFSFILLHDHFKGVFDYLLTFICNIHVPNAFFKHTYALDNG